MSEEEVQAKPSPETEAAATPAADESVQDGPKRPEPTKINNYKQYYLEKCEEFGVTANSAFANTLPVKGDDTSENYDFRSNFFGDKGVKAVTEVIKYNKRFSSLSLRNNGIRNAGVQYLTEMLKSHPSVTRLDVSSNLISKGGGLSLVDLLKSNPNIKELNYSDNKIDVNVRLQIKNALDANQKAAEEAAPPS